MMCYKDMTFCDFNKCVNFGTCHRSLTTKVFKSAKKLGLYISKFVNKPDCFDDGKRDKKGIKKEYYEKVGKKYKKIEYWDFPSRPVNGLWLVNEWWGGRGRGIVAFLEDIQNIDMKTINMLSQYKDACANLLVNMESGPIIPSAGERINKIFKLLSEKAKEKKSGKTKNPSVRH